MYSKYNTITTLVFDSPRSANRSSLQHKTTELDFIYTNLMCIPIATYVKDRKALRKTEVCCLLVFKPMLHETKTRNENYIFRKTMRQPMFISSIGNRNEVLVQDLQNSGGHEERKIFSRAKCMPLFCTTRLDDFLLLTNYNIYLFMSYSQGCFSSAPSHFTNRLH